MRAVSSFISLASLATSCSDRSKELIEFGREMGGVARGLGRPTGAGDWPYGGSVLPAMDAGEGPNGIAGGSPLVAMDAGP